MPLSAQRKAQFVECFEILGNKAAEVDRSTMGDIMRSLGQNPTQDEVKQLFEKVAGGESSVSCEKLLAAAGEFEDRMAKGDALADLKEAFAVFDKDKSGSISAAELRHVISNLGEPVDEDEMEDMMKEADKDGNGMINYKEFVSVLLNAQSLPPPIVIPDELKPYWDAIKAKEGGKKGEKEAA